jgi:hypothetical protein
MTGAVAAASGYRAQPAPGSGAPGIVDATVSGNNIVGYGLTDLGDITNRLDNVSSDVGDWLAPKIGMGGYEVQATQVSSTVRRPNYTAGSASFAKFIRLDTTREWKLSATVGEPSQTVELAIEIRDRNSHETLAIATIVLDSTYV